MFIMSFIDANRSLVDDSVTIIHGKTLENIEEKLNEIECYEKIKLSFNPTNKNQIEIIDADYEEEGYTIGKVEGEEFILFETVLV